MVFSSFIIFYSIHQSVIGHKYKEYPEQDTFVTLYAPYRKPILEPFKIFGPTQRQCKAIYPHFSEGGHDNIYITKVKTYLF
jgi:hypothetical protein